MKICFVTTEFVSEEHHFDGGLANYVYKISKTLISLDNEVTVILKSDTNEEFLYDGIPIIKVKIDLHAPFYRFIKKILGRGEDLDWIYTSFLLNRKVSRIHSEKKFDIVQFSSFRAISLFRPSNIPTIVRISSFHLGLNLLLGQSDIPLVEQKKASLEQEAVKKADVVFGPGRAVANLMHKATGKQIEIIETLYDPVVLSNEIENEYPQLAKQKYLLFVGKLNALKGTEVISNMIYKLLDKEQDLHFAFAGIDAGYKDLLLANAKEYSNRVHILGRVKKPQLYKVMKDSFALVLPSLVDNFPNTAVEGMSLGKIVVGTSGVGYEQLIKDEVSGFLTTPGDSESLLQTILKVVSLNDAKRKSIEEAAIKATEKLKPDTIALQTINLYERTIQEFKKKNKK